jgi:hypothetical protein
LTGLAAGTALGSQRPEVVGVVAPPALIPLASASARSKYSIGSPAGRASSYRSRRQTCRPRPPDGGRKRGRSGVRITENMTSCGCSPAIAKVSIALRARKKGPAVARPSLVRGRNAP